MKIVIWQIPLKLTTAWQKLAEVEARAVIWESPGEDITWKVGEDD